MNAYRRLSAAWALCIAFASLASAQYAHTYEDKDGEVTASSSKATRNGSLPSRTRSPTFTLTRAWWLSNCLITKCRIKRCNISSA
jgi:hypothetical protein